MSENAVIAMLGRRLRLGVIGGGGSSLIGPIHRLAARSDDYYELVAGVLSSNAERSEDNAAKLGISRSYASVDEMIAGEGAREDRVDVIAIMSPDDTHVPYAIKALEAGFHVVCEKPLSTRLEDARRVAEVARASGSELCLVHNYSGYPMVREARAAVAAGELGRVHLVVVTYLQGALGTMVEADPDQMPSRLKWRLDPSRGGQSHALSDIGSHAHHLTRYITGEEVTDVFADLGAAIAGRMVHDSASVLIRLGNGARGSIIASKAASGAVNRFSIEVYGDKAGLVWDQANANELQITRQGQPAETRMVGLPTLHPLTKKAVQRTGAFPGGFVEAFANIYSDFAEIVAARIAGCSPNPLTRQIPGVDDGVAGLMFIDACITSSKEVSWRRCS
ncbi:Gfo/Idh/MocA family protein [Devosia sp. SL43]|uniref:Gfo/Idh/MocA family protein n=1 Tax=Devosia sp. SL43 TaxID=2806348 RepID=UPI001F429B7E|nr:Gfo/Idh/MocA family oxidoreductase [Devosia sp. SL43]UJW86523.1 Gfo/Idh/MocA family oxidoreductase [Devosia sp. SL43]